MKVFVVISSEDIAAYDDQYALCVVTDETRARALAQKQMRLTACDAYVQELELDAKPGKGRPHTANNRSFRETLKE